MKFQGNKNGGLKEPLQGKRKNEVKRGGIIWRVWWREKKKDSTETKKDDKVRKHANPFPTTPCQEVCWIKQNKIRQDKTKQNNYLNNNRTGSQKNIVNQLNHSVLPEKNHLLLLVQKITRNFKINKRVDDILTKLH